MKILDAGTTTLSNIDVLHWIESKRAQHAAEDAADHDAGQKSSKRPTNFLQSLSKHEAELGDARKYPYSSNPSAYAERPYDAMARFDQLLLERICVPLEDKYHPGGELNPNGTLKAADVEAKLGKEQEEKGLTETEHLMLLNHAPASVEQLQPMVEGCEERFSADEQQVIVDCILEVYRADQPRAEAVAVDGEMEVEQDAGDEVEGVGKVE